MAQCLEREVILAWRVNITSESVHKSFLWGNTEITKGSYLWTEEGFSPFFLSLSTPFWLQGLCFVSPRSEVNDLLGKDVSDEVLKPPDWKKEGGRLVSWSRSCQGSSGYLQTFITFQLQPFQEVRMAEYHAPFSHFTCVWSTTESFGLLCMWQLQITEFEGKAELPGRVLWQRWGRWVCAWVAGARTKTKATVHLNQWWAETWSRLLTWMITFRKDVSQKCLRVQRGSTRMWEGFNGLKYLKIMWKTWFLLMDCHLSLGYTTGIL